MPALNTDTRLVMTILFVGTISGANVFFYANYGITFPHGVLAHSILFGLGTIGSIMVMKALFDLSLNDRIEVRLLDRQIESHFQRVAREQQIRQKLRDSMKQYGVQRREAWNTVYPEQPTASFEESQIPNEFLATIQQ